MISSLMGGGPHRPGYAAAIMLYARRLRLKQLAEAEAGGKSFWSARFDEAARMKLVYAFNDSCNEAGRDAYGPLARAFLVRDEGWPSLTQSTRRRGPLEDLLAFHHEGSDALLPSMIEAIVQAFETPGRAFGGTFEITADPDGYRELVNTILREHRISYELVGVEMVPFASKELHAAIVEPTLRLLSGQSGWENVEQAYQDALGELADGKPADAITDAGTALQEALTLLGCTGNALGPLVSSARRMGLLAAHDSPMVAAIETVMHWVSADRSTRACFSDRLGIGRAGRVAR
jgi:hypothetical protein